MVERMHDVRGKRCQANGCIRQPGFGHQVWGHAVGRSLWRHCAQLCYLLVYPCAVVALFTPDAAGVDRQHGRNISNFYKTHFHG